VSVAAGWDQCCVCPCCRGWRPPLPPLLLLLLQSAGSRPPYTGATHPLLVVSAVLQLHGRGSQV
jgi:hypothetical protein